MTNTDNPYGGLAEDDAHAGDQWAFGTGFTAALAGVDTALPVGIDQDDLALYCQMLGDDALVAAQRLIQWSTAAPELEEEMALANIALDLLGQARLLLARAGQVDGSGRDEDAFAYLRDAREFRNVCLAETPNGDFAHAVVRLLVLSAWRLALFTRLADTADPVLAAVAAKGSKELAYHREYAVRWTLRLGDGTPESRDRMTAALDQVWPLTGELFATHPVEARLADQGAAVDPAGVRAEVGEVVARVLVAATLEVPPAVPVPEPTGRAGLHGPELAAMLHEMQSVARAHPEATW
ncbi:1,2-phenylacetyl-CoA epoxidase subunit PaaC [Nocardiopsis ansamitocini]|uniref:Phenylacetate-CoA oxygenase subunit PaaI n=1 Tax=Nocardiopsis ansamitocini TaxID=1670832 RepID=A0A9W6P374_9ACTN|nr:1,2-phenylacetyl-CoA epoxidase subunit PaaC [Nocardiopsis ansamitocini]GLU46272.1 phenylacetate-CoA oxygenase subunit PaaI [Nocardiopsis ansamitocini]